MATLQQVEFQNNARPEAQFDLLKIEDLLIRNDLSHDITQIQRVEFYLIVLDTGESNFHTIDFTDYEVQKGTILTVRKDQVQKFHSSKYRTGYLLLFTDNFLMSYLEELENIKTLQLFNELLSAPKIQLSERDYNEIILLIQRIENEYLNHKDSHSLEIIRSELHILITKLFRIKSKTDPVFITKKYLQEFVLLQNLVEKRIFEIKKVADYAKMMGLSTKTLNTITKSILNKTAKEFIDEILIKQIKRLLINTPYSIKEVAYTAGFEETTNFYKYFKKHLNLTPEQFRAQST